jgi:hypothetical protein
MALHARATETPCAIPRDVHLVMGAMKPPPPLPAPPAREPLQATMGEIALPVAPPHPPQPHAQRPAQEQAERDGRLPPRSMPLLVDPPSPPSDSTHRGSSRDTNW